MISVYTVIATLIALVFGLFFIILKRQKDESNKDETKRKNNDEIKFGLNNLYHTKHKLAILIRWKQKMNNLLINTHNDYEKIQVCLKICNKVINNIGYHKFIDLLFKLLSQTNYIDYDACFDIVKDEIIDSNKIENINLRNENESNAQHSFLFLDNNSFGNVLQYLCLSEIFALKRLNHEMYYKFDVIDLSHRFDSDELIPWKYLNNNPNDCYLIKKYFNNTKTFNLSRVLKNICV